MNFFPVITGSIIEKTYSSENLPSPPFGKGREEGFIFSVYTIMD